MAEEEIKNDATYTETEVSGTSGSESFNSFVLKERFEILFSTPLPEHDTNGASAYKVNDRINSKRDLFALVCSNETAPRLSILPYLKSIDNPHIMKLVEYGIVTCPPQGAQHMVLIYQVPTGSRLNNLDAIPDLRKTPEKFKQILFSLINALECLKGYGFTHRSIRLDNLYFKDESCSEIILGDCAASFPAYHQPPVYETIESLIALPEGRGDGRESNDAYSAGITMLSLLCQKEFLSGLSTPEVLRLKLKKGSFYVLSAEDKIPNTYVSLFKGILLDSAEERWTYTQIYNYLDSKPSVFGLTSTT